ncbi:hypothetical protein OROGR_020212 [Orobanche gracilis]
MQHARPPIMSHVGPPQNLYPPPPMSMQFRHMIPPPPPPQAQFVAVVPQQFQPGGYSNVGMPPHPQYSQMVPPQPLQPPLQTPGPPQGPPLAQPQMSNNFVPSFGGPGISHTPYNFSSSSGGQPQINMGPAAQQLPMPQMDAPSFGQPWFSTGNQNVQSVVPMQQMADQSSVEQTWLSSGTHSIKPVTPLQQNGEQNNAGIQPWRPNGNQSVQSCASGQTEEKSVCVMSQEKNSPSDLAKKASIDWKEHIPREGKKYYYNKRTKVSSWEKPLELMSAIERADASTDWREVITPDGRRFYYNKVTKQSKWAIPDEVKLARERTNTASSEGIPTRKDGTRADSMSLPTQEMALSPVSVTPVVNPDGSSSMLVEVTNLKSDATELQAPMEIPTSVAESDTPVSVSTPTRISDVSPQEAQPSSVKNVTGTIEEGNGSSGICGGGGNKSPDEEKVNHGSLVYESKEGAKNAFKDLLETANVGFDWNWEQAMRVITNDRRYGALRTLGERKQAFNEFVGLKKKQEAEEKRAKQKKAREDFKNMLQESEDLISSTIWSDAVSMFEKDERFEALERVKDREDLFEDHLEEVKKKERSRALEEHKHHIAEYLEFLKSCDFIKASSQWRKVQHHLEADERCMRLEKIERFEIFQEYVRDLEMEEEETRKLRMEETRKTERKNRDEFRKLMEDHVANGILTAKSHWRDYCVKVKDAPAYTAVSSNTSGFTAKDLFDDVIEDLEKQYLEDKEKIDEAIKNEKISLSMTWTLDDFKIALSKGISTKPVSDINLKLVFDELLEIAKGKEEKEAKKRRRLAEGVQNFLFTSKEISLSSKWEDCKSLVEGRFNGEESFLREIFNKFILELKEKAKEKERKRKEEKRKYHPYFILRYVGGTYFLQARKEKERENRDRKGQSRRNRDRVIERRKGRERHNKIDERDSDGSESFGLEENKRSWDRIKRHHRRHAGSLDGMILDDEDKERWRPCRRSVDPKRPKQMENNAERDSESQSKRHKRDHRDGSGKNTDGEERRKDSEVDEDVEVN